MRSSTCAAGRLVAVVMIALSPPLPGSASNCHRQAMFDGTLGHNPHVNYSQRQALSLLHLAKLSHFAQFP